MAITDDRFINEFEEEKKDYRSAAETRARTTIKIAKERDIFEDRLDLKNEELLASDQAKIDEEADKGFFGKLFTLGATAACIATTGGVLTPACLGIGAGSGLFARGVTDYFGDAEGSPDAIDFSDAVYYRNMWESVEEDVDSQRAALESFDDNAWKNDVLAQVTDTWDAFELGANLDELGIFRDTKSVVPKPDMEM
jgi:hypothetical protein